MSLNVGDKAPDFNVLADDGEMVSLKKLAGKKVVLYFYPKDDTPGCTKEACAFRDILPDFTRVNAVVLGVSKDTPASHKKFKKKYDLPFTLLCDADASLCQAYGVIKKNSMFGKTFLGIERSTFLIDERGKIQAIWRKVKVAGHVEEVLIAANA